MDPSSPVADLTAFFIQVIGSLLFGLVFLFLWRQSRAVYFGLWAAAWGLRAIATVFGFELLSHGGMGWLAPYTTFDFAFAIVLIAAARAGFGTGLREWRAILRLIALLPVFVTAVFAVAMFSRLEAYHSSHALLLGFIYLYLFLQLRRQGGLGFRMFRFSLLVLSAAFFEHAFIFLWMYNRGNAPDWARYLHHETYYDFALHCVMAFSAMAMWSETQMDRLRGLVAEVESLRRENSNRTDVDGLTGLLNQAALSRRVEQPAPLDCVVAVCDMDSFKEVNDRYGHLVGDEILRNVGNLLGRSIRHEDEAYRWGGDEFVILFLNQSTEGAAKRMAELEQRLSDFQVRGFGVLPISFSWGVADGRERPLRDALDEADRAMYALKRSRGELTRERQQAI
ncbi:MAG: GGDEF domain-containing protein [Bryobacteraceae bacterium]|jgi:diguanylate cyclase (GGDEF)-like protein